MRLLTKIGIAVLVFFVHYSVEAQKIKISGTAPTMSIAMGTAQTQPFDATNSLCQLRYSTPAGVWKITIQTNNGNPRFTLRAEALNVSDGIATGTVTLNDTNAHDFITSIPDFKGNAWATISYTASALYSQGNSLEFGDDLHQVTFTITQ